MRNSYVRRSMTSRNESDVVHKMSEKDLEHIDNYASLLTSATGMDDNQSYAMALDAYVIGVDQCNNLLAPTIIPSIMEPAPQQQAPLATESVIEELDYYGASLSQLFRLPAEFGDDGNDIDLVNAYGEELEVKGGIAASVAYGVALDTYLADPIGFRNMFRRQNVVESTAVATKLTSKASEEHSLDYYGASLCKLFDTANNSDQDISDIRLVTAYAEDLEINGRISAAIAYGIALDVYLTDPADFRIRFNPKTSLVVENIDESVASNEDSKAYKDEVSEAPILMIAACNEKEHQIIAPCAPVSPAITHTTTRKPKRKADCTVILQDDSIKPNDSDAFVQPEAPPVKVKRAVANKSVDMQEQRHEEKSQKAKRNTAKKEVVVVPENEVEEEVEIALAILCDRLV